MIGEVTSADDFEDVVVVLDGALLLQLSQVLDLQRLLDFGVGLSLTTAALDFSHVLGLNHCLR